MTAPALSPGDHRRLESYRVDAVSGRKRKSRAKPVGGPGTVITPRAPATVRTMVAGSRPESREHATQSPASPGVRPGRRGCELARSSSAAVGQQADTGQVLGPAAHLAA